MKIYWSQNSIPALKHLSPSERDAAKRAATRDVWKHWQVWLPFAFYSVRTLCSSRLLLSFRTGCWL